MLGIKCNRVYHFMFDNISSGKFTFESVSINSYYASFPCKVLFVLKSTRYTLRKVKFFTTVLLQYCGHSTNLSDLTVFLLGKNLFHLFQYLYVMNKTLLEYYIILLAIKYYSRLSFQYPLWIKEALYYIFHKGIVPNLVKIYFIFSLIRKNKLPFECKHLLIVRDFKTI